MSKVIQSRGGTTAQHATFIGAAREVTVDTTKNTVVVHDGATAGGFPMAKKSELDAVAAVANSKLASTANAVSATKLATARTIALTGDVTGSVTFDGSSNASITTVIADDSHNHTIANVDGLQTALDGKLAATANAVSATKLATARTVSLTGDITGSTTFDGSHNVSITTVIADDSHNHTVANVDGLQAALDTKTTKGTVSTSAASGGVSGDVWYQY